MENLSIIKDVLSNYDTQMSCTKYYQCMLNNVDNDNKGHFEKPTLVFKSKTEQNLGINFNHPHF